MHATETYDIHNRLIVRANASIPVPDHFRTNNSSKAAVVEVEERSGFNPPVPSHARKLASHHYWFENDTLTVRYPTTPMGSPVTLRISGISERETKLIYTPRFRSNTDFTSLFEGILTIKLLNAGLALVHAGAVVEDGEATVLTSMGRMGKTSTLLRLLDKNDELGFMGDNKLLLDRSGQVYGWPGTLGVFPGTAVSRQQLPEKTRWSVLIKRLIARSELVSAALLHKFSIDLSEDLAPEDVSSNIVDAAPVSQVFVLNGGRPDTNRQPLSLADAAVKIGTGTDMELDPEDYYLSLYAFASDDKDAHPEQIRERRRTLIKDALTDIDVTELFADGVSGYVDQL